MDKYIYDDKKGFLLELPARDIYADEWALYPEKLTQTALKLGMYKIKKAEEAKKEVKNAQSA